MEDKPLLLKMFPFSKWHSFIFAEWIPRLFHVQNPKEKHPTLNKTFHFFVRPSVLTEGSFPAMADTLQIAKLFQVIQARGITGCDTGYNTWIR